MKATVGTRYRHYKGKEYTVLALARHEDTPDRISVVYRAEYDAPDFGNNVVWIRHIDSFEGMVTMPDGTLVPRFAPIM